MNAVGWLLHLLVLAYSWPQIRYWWTGDPSRPHYSGVPWGRMRGVVLASLLLPIVAWAWLIPNAVTFRRQQAQRAIAEEQAARDAAHLKQHRVDVAFWRAQADSDDPVEVMNALDLLAMWGAQVVEPEARPGAHKCSPHCECRNCKRAWEDAMQEARRMVLAGFTAPSPIDRGFTIQRDGMTVQPRWAPPYWGAPGHAFSCGCTRCRPDLWENEIYL